MNKPIGQSTRSAAAVKVLVIDIGGTHVKVRAEGQDSAEKFSSGPTMTPQQMVDGVKRIAAGLTFDVMSFGYPGPVLHGKPVIEPHNLAPGWVGFDLHAAFGCRLRLVNDAAMQALGGYHGGRMLFLGLGTGLGSALVINGVVQPMEIGHLPYRKATFEDYVGARGLKRSGKKKWRSRVEDVVTHLKSALEPSDVLIGGGNAALLKALPPGCRAGTNDDAFYGGVRLWHGATAEVMNLADAAGAGQSPGAGRR